jgi:hypothetical protein
MGRFLFAVDQFARCWYKRAQAKGVPTTVSLPRKASAGRKKTGFFLFGGGFFGAFSIMA